MIPKDTLNTMPETTGVPDADRMFRDTMRPPPPFPAMPSAPRRAARKDPLPSPLRPEMPDTPPRPPPPPPPPAAPPPPPSVVALRRQQGLRPLSHA